MARSGEARIERSVDEEEMADTLSLVLTMASQALAFVFIVPKIQRDAKHIASPRLASTICRPSQTETE